jgi:hypothetical protein
MDGVVYTISQNRSMGVTDIYYENQPSYYCTLIENPKGWHMILHNHKYFHVTFHMFSIYVTGDLQYIGMPIIASLNYYKNTLSEEPGGITI